MGLSDIISKRLGNLWSHETWCSGLCYLGFEGKKQQKEAPAFTAGLTAGLLTLDQAERSVEVLKRSPWWLVGLACIH